MKLTVLVDNNTLIDQYYVGEPGVSYYIEDEDSTLLFDTGWALSMAVIALPYYLHTGSILVGIAQHTPEAVLESLKC